MKWIDPLKKVSPENTKLVNAINELYLCYSIEF